MTLNSDDIKYIGHKGCGENGYNRRKSIEMIIKACNVIVCYM